MPEAFQDEEAADAGSGGLGDEAVGASETSFPVETSITITKPSGGAMTIDAIAQGEPRTFTHGATDCSRARARILMTHIL